ncbi:MAG: trypsin-like peptidase domain-containing protein, partial [Candidatus Obscuribacterales bacterium]|nr:trypsin-like peptidase domain-containing protein [Candidatus Obscuribacterales bacterium]
MGDKRGEIPVLKLGMDIADPNEPQPQIDDLTRKLYEDCLPKTVQITTDKGLGSGFFMDKDGRIGTAAHVILGSREQFAVASDGTRWKLQIEKIDDVNDAAILKAVAFKSGSRPVAEIGKSSDLKPDQPIFPIGHPGGLRPAYISPGYFRKSTTEQELFESQDPQAKDAIKDALTNLTPRELPDVQAALSRDLLHGAVHIRPGDSGGPMFDANGRVLGINDMITLPKDGSNIPSDGFFVPAEKIKALYDSQDSKFDFTYNRLAAPWAQT